MLDVLSGGHLMTQLAACERAAGVAIVPHAPLLELRGPAGQLMPVAARCGWWRRASAHRYLVLADVRSGDELDELRRRLARWAPDVAAVDRSADHTCVVLTGPLATQLESQAGVRRSLIVAGDGDQHRVLVVPAGEAEDLQYALLDAGRDAGVVAIDARAADLRRAARHVALMTLPITTGAQPR